MVPPDVFVALHYFGASVCYVVDCLRKECVRVQKSSYAAMWAAVIPGLPSSTELRRMCTIGQELIFGVPGLPIALGCNESFPGGSRSGYADHF